MVASLVEEVQLGRARILLNGVGSDQQLMVVWRPINRGDVTALGNDREKDRHGFTLPVSQYQLVRQTAAGGIDQVLAVMRPPDLCAKTALFRDGLSVGSIRFR